MKPITLFFIAAFALSACGGEPTDQQPTDQSASSIEKQTPVALKTIPLSYADYQTAANKGLTAQHTGFSLPDHAVLTDNPEGKNLQHDFLDGLVLTVDTDKAEKIAQIRVVWSTDTAPDKADQLSKAAAALIAATAPEDRTLLRDTGDQIKMAIDSHNAQKDPTREWARGGVAYKVTVTNLPSVVLTANAQ